MRARAVRMIVSIVAVVCVLMGLPGAFFASVSIWSSEQRNLDVQLPSASSKASTAGARWGRARTLRPWPRSSRIRRIGAATNSATVFSVPGHNLVTNEHEPTGRTMAAFAESPSGVSPSSSLRRRRTRLPASLWTCGMFGGGMIASMLIGLAHGALALA